MGIPDPVGKMTLPAENRHHRFPEYQQIGACRGEKNRSGASVAGFEEKSQTEKKEDNRGYFIKRDRQQAEEGEPAEAAPPQKEQRGENNGDGHRFEVELKEDTDREDGMKKIAEGEDEGPGSIFQNIPGEEVGRKNTESDDTNLADDKTVFPPDREDREEKVEGGPEMVGGEAIVKKRCLEKFSPGKIPEELGVERHIQGAGPVAVMEKDRVGRKKDSPGQEYQNQPLLNPVICHSIKHPEEIKPDRSASSNSILEDYLTL